LLFIFSVCGFSVETVIDYYNKWMKKWPTPHALANATLEVLSPTSDR
jgi:adenine-specific DNA glycosylase